MVTWTTRRRQRANPLPEDILIPFLNVSSLRCVIVYKRLASTEGFHMTEGLQWAAVAMSSLVMPLLWIEGPAMVGSAHTVAKPSAQGNRVVGHLASRVQPVLTVVPFPPLALPVLMA